MADQPNSIDLTSQIEAQSRGAQAQALQQAPPPRPPIANAEEYGFVGLPSENSIRALKVFCKQLVGTPFLPKSLVKDQSDDQQAGTLLAVCLTGREMSPPMTPMQSLRAFWLSPDGRLGMYVDAMFGLMLANGAEFNWVKLDNEGAELITTRTTRGKTNTYRSVWTVEDAKRAGLLTKDKSIWPKYPRNMCRSRVGGDTFRTLFADCAGGGNIYTREEVIDMDPDESGSYNARESADEQADRAAESNPAYAVVAGESSTRQAKSQTRGRKTEPVQTTAAAGAQTVDVKPETAQTVDAKSETAKPEQTTAVSKPEPPKEEPKELSPQARLNAVQAKVQLRTGCDTVKHLRPFYKGFFNGQFPKDVAAYIDPTEYLLRELERAGDDAVSVFLKEPERIGRLACGHEKPKQAEPEKAEETPEVSTAEAPQQEKTAEPETKQQVEISPEIRNTFPKWSDETLEYAAIVAAKYSKTVPLDRFLKGLKVMGTGELNNDDARLALTLCAHNRSDSLALIKGSITAKKPLLEIVNAIESRLKTRLMLNNDTPETALAVTSALSDI